MDDTGNCIYTLHTVHSFANLYMPYPIRTCRSSCVFDCTMVHDRLSPIPSPLSAGERMPTRANPNRRPSTQHILSLANIHLIC